MKSAFYLNIKRAVDILLSLFLLFALLPVILTVATIVKLTSKGKIFYVSERIGRFGKPFKMFKFRTMIPEAPTVGPSWSGSEDPRITGIGSFLRRTKLDELPQLLNVLLGDMSFVGPRAELAEYVKDYSEQEKQIILSLRPGITDFASIEFSNLGELIANANNPEQYIETYIQPRKRDLRIKYVKTLSPVNDLKILWRTFTKVVLKH